MEKRRKSSLKDSVVFSIIQHNTLTKYLLQFNSEDCLICIKIRSVSHLLVRFEKPHEFS